METTKRVTKKTVTEWTLTESDVEEAVLSYLKLKSGFIEFEVSQGCFAGCTVRLEEIDEQGR